MDQGINGYRTGTVYFELILPLNEKQGQFETGSMGWLATYTDVKYEIVMEANRQILRGSFLAEPSAANPSTIGNSISEMNVVIRVLRMKNGEKVQPTFTLWLEGNKVDAQVVDGIPTNVVTGSAATCETHGGKEYQTVTPAEITVSAAQRFNLALERAAAPFTSQLDTFDFSTGNNLALNKSTGTVSGRIFCYGLTLQLVGKDATSGLKGVEIPDDGGTITFDITMGSKYTDYNSKTTNLDSTAFRAQVWSAAPSQMDIAQQDGRTIPTARNHPANAAPFNTPKANSSKRDGCFNGGTWTFTQDATNKQLYHVTVSGFKFDVSSVTNFPATTGDHNGVDSEGVYYNAASMQNAWNVQTACFSAGELWVVQPLKAKVNGTMKKIEEIYSDGNLEYSLKDTNFKVNGKATTQAVTTDDQSAYAFGLELPGAIESDIYYVTYNGSWNKPLTPGEFMGGYDYATPGQPMGIYHLISNDNPEGDHRGCAMEIFTKFDESFFDPDGKYKIKVFSPSSSNNVWWSGEQPEIKVLWVSRVYGRGWNNQRLTPDKSNSLGTGNDVEGDNYDWDMISAFSDGMSNGEQFEFYESLEKLEAATYVDSNGKTQHEQCIGVLVEIRGIVAPGMNHVELTINGKVREDCKPGYVYATVTHSRLWRIADVDGTAKQWYKDQGKVTDTTWTGNKRLQYIDQYVKEIMPSHLYYRDFEDKNTKPTKGFDGQTIPNTKYSVYELGMFKQIYWDKRVGGKTPVDRDKNHSNALQNTMQKIWYKSDGTTGGTYNRFHADNCLVVSHEVSIKKSTAQTVIDNGKTNSKTVYSLDKGQRVVDFKLTPSIKRTLGTGVAGEGNQTKTTITIKDTLPKELEYISGSACWGGTYTQDPGCANPGTVTGGTKLNPNVTKNSDGTTTLTWTLKDVVLTRLDTMELAPIYFSTRLTGALEDQQTIKNTATIQSTHDNLRKLTEANNNKAIFGITIQKSANVSIVKLADQDKVEINVPHGFTMYVGNNSSNDLNNQIIVDDFPYNNDAGGTSVHGAINVTEFTVNDLGRTNCQWFYTTDTKFQGKTSIYYMGNDKTTGVAGRDASQINYFTTANGWHSMTFDSAGKCTNLPVNTVQVVGVGTVPAGRTIQMHTTVALPGSCGGDVIYNNLMMDSLNSRASSRVVSRSISGLTWIDLNHDGIQDSAEMPAKSGVKVTLMKQDTSGQYQDVVSIQTGQQYDVTRGTAAQSYEQGKYLFYNLMPGTYAVRFEKGDFDITYYHPSPVNTGMNLDNFDQVDSDGVPTLAEDHTLLKTEITGIVMPTIEAMGEANTFDSPYHDSGFHPWTVELPNTGSTGTKSYTAAGWILVMGAAVLAIRKKRKRT